MLVDKLVVVFPKSHSLLIWINYPDYMKSGYIVGMQSLRTYYSQTRLYLSVHNVVDLACKKTDYTDASRSYFQKLLNISKSHPFQILDIQSN